MSIETALRLGRWKKQGDTRTPAVAHYCVALSLCVLLTGCGSSMAGILQADSELLWHAEEVIGAAEQLDRDLEDSVYDAEAEKHEACEFITKAAREQMFADEPSFADQFSTDIAQLLVRIVPVGRVERCAQAQRRYKEEVATLCQELNDSGIEMRCND